jgi:hypothetical protein
MEVGPDVVQALHPFLGVEVEHPWTFVGEGAEFGIDGCHAPECTTEGLPSPYPTEV